MILPFLLVMALLIYLESGRPIFYKDERMGKDGKPFSCLKFRTMVSNAETLLQTMLEEDAEFREEYSKYHKLHDDPRVTRVGHFLRKTSLDELPQIWNVLRGGMSLVGPDLTFRASPKRSSFARTRYCAFLRASLVRGRFPGATTFFSARESSWTLATCATGRYGWTSCSWLVP